MCQIMRLSLINPIMVFNIFGKWTTLFFFCRIKEESSSEIQFPVLDENDELNDAEQLLQLEGQYIDLTISVKL